MQATMDNKGRISLPRAFRDKLQLGTGDRVLLVIDEGTLRLIPKNTSVRRLKGLLASSRDKAVPLKQIEESIASGAVDE